MAVIPATQLRTGMLITYNKELHRVTNVVHVTPGNWRGMVQTKLRNLRSGTQTENRFRSEDKVERVTLEQHDMEFLYQSDELYYFMNAANYEQMPLDAETLGDGTKYLTPNLRLHGRVPRGDAGGRRPAEDRRPESGRYGTGHEGRDGHQSAEAGDDRDRAWSSRCPPFIDVDDVIRVDTENGQYLSRAK